MRSSIFVFNSTIQIQEKSIWAGIASLFFRGKPTAMVLGKTIHLSGVSAAEFQSDRKWVLHELEHIRQFEELGFWNFLFQYTLESIKKGYYQNKFEVAARHAELQA